MDVHTYLPIIIDLPAKMQRALIAPSLWDMPKKTHARTKLRGSKDGYPVAALPPPSQLMLGRCGNQRCAHYQACPGRTTSMSRPGAGGQEIADVRNRLAGSSWARKSWPCHLVVCRGKVSEDRPRHGDGFLCLFGNPANQLGQKNVLFAIIRDLRHFGEDGPDASASSLRGLG
jgi:hypothetical protein